ncbi:MAG: hypothetical protein V4736_00270 [Bdellovibrionota bacterium]
MLKLRAIHLLFVPGLYGSTLVDSKTNEREWVNVSQVVFHHEGFALPTPGIDQPGIKNLKVGEVLKGVPVLGPFYSVNSYGKILEILEKICKDKNCNLVPVPYDWRREPAEVVKSLQETITRVRKSPEDKIYLVAHSYGAVNTSYFLRYGTQDNYETAIESWEGLKQLDGVVLVAAPFRGGTALFRNVLQGARYFGGRADFVLQTDYATFESPYFLMPPEGKLSLFDEDFKKIIVPVHSAQYWKDKQWGLFSPELQKRQKDSAVVFNHLDTILKRVSTFYKKQFAPVINEPPKKSTVVYIGTKGSPTDENGIDIGNKSPGNVAFYDKERTKYLPKLNPDKLKVDGDGSITTETQSLPTGIEKALTNTYFVNDGHLEILHSKEFEKEVRAMLSR